MFLAVSPPFVNAVTHRRAYARVGRAFGVISIYKAPASNSLQSSLHYRFRHGKRAYFHEDMLG